MARFFSCVVLGLVMTTVLYGQDSDDATSVGLVDVFAGNGRSPAKRAGGRGIDHYAKATDARLGNPFGVEVIDESVWISTVDDHCVWRCDLKGADIRRIVGDGTVGSAGDGGPAKVATFNWPHEIRIDDSGNLFIADTRNHRIRWVDAESGTAHALAGRDVAGYAGDGKAGGDVQFDQPHSVVLDGTGGVLVADTKNHRVRRIDIESGIVTTICGTGAKKLPVSGGIALEQPVFGPRSLAVDDESIWLVLREGNSLWRIDRGDGKIYHVAGTGKKGYSGDGGAPLEARFRGPKGIAIDSQGRVLVVDTENHAVRRIDLQANRIETVLGGTMADSTLSLKRPHGIAALPDGGFLVADSENHRVVRWRESH